MIGIQGMLKMLEFQAAAFRITGVEMVDMIVWIQHWSGQRDFAQTLISLVHAFPVGKEKGDGAPQIGFLSLAESQQQIAFLEDLAGTLVQPELHLECLCVKGGKLIKNASAQKDDAGHNNLLIA